MACYCANFYGSVNCHNQVSRFGDRCKLCIALKSGASMSDGLLSSDSDQWVKTSRPDDMATRTRHHDVMPLGGAQHGKHHLRADVRYGRKQ